MRKAAWIPNDMGRLEGVTGLPIRNTDLSMDAKLREDGLDRRGHVQGGNARYICTRTSTPSLVLSNANLSST